MLQDVIAFLAPTLFLAIGLLVAAGLGWIVSILIVGLPRKLLRYSFDVPDWLSRFYMGITVSRLIDTIAVVLFLVGVFTLGSKGKWGSLAPELVSTSVAIAVLDRLFNYRGEQREKRRTISQMGATDSNDVALAALAVARAENWLNDGTLRGANLYRANLSGANLSDANLSGANLSGANLSGATLIDADLSGVTLFDANLSGANLIGATLINAYLSDANLSGATLIDADLSGATLFDANLSGANLIGATLINAYLSDANLSGATLYRAVLIDAYLSDATLIDAKYNSKTVWPDDFDPSESGAVFQQE